MTLNLHYYNTSCILKSSQCQFTIFVTNRELRLPAVTRDLKTNAEPRTHTTKICSITS